MTDYNVYSASGNPTALVWALNQSEEARKDINTEIMSDNPIVEQVGFLLPRTCGLMYPGAGGTTATGNFALTMAGGEFCANATRCAIYAYLNGEEGIIDISVSGVLHPLRGGVRIQESGDKVVWCEMPIVASQDMAVSQTQDGAIVKLQGITHLVVNPEKSKLYIDDKQADEIKAIAFELIKKYALNKELAAGVIFITASYEDTQDMANISILPVVYVRKVDTLFNETACGSGTVAVALAYSAARKRSFELKALQPFGEYLSAKVEYAGGEFKRVVLEGPVKEYQ